MIFTFRLFNWRFNFTFAPVTNVTGVNSRLPNNKHILMWDFDDVPLIVVQTSLGIVQKQYRLPNIYIFNTGTPNHYIAYCFAKLDWRLSVEIVASTPMVDPNFFKYGVYRERWTLRVSKKEGRKPKRVLTLHSRFPEECTIADLNSWVQYETLADNAPMGKKVINIAKRQ